MQATSKCTFNVCLKGTVGSFEQDNNLTTNITES